MIHDLLPFLRLIWSWFCWLNWCIFISCFQKYCQINLTAVAKSILCAIIIFSNYTNQTVHQTLHVYSWFQILEKLQKLTEVLFVQRPCHAIQSSVYCESKKTLLPSFSGILSTIIIFSKYIKQTCLDNIRNRTTNSKRRK